MSFRLTNAPAICQRQNDDILREFLGITVICYLDDILVFLEQEEDYKKHVRAVLRALVKVDSCLKLFKYYFRVKEVKFLGYII